MLIFDIECNGLTPDKIHCMSVIDVYDRVMWTGTTELWMKNKLEKQKVLIGHNITRFDIPILERLVGFSNKVKLVDTLALSWYLYPDRMRHGLEWWGEEFGIAKPPITNWENLPLTDYINRCEEDVRINLMLWDKMWADLMVLYNNDEDAIWKLIEYLQFKMDCAREQEKSGWKLDVKYCTSSLETMSKEYDIAYENLKEGMPQIPIISKVSRPAKPFKKNGSLSVIGMKWFDLLEERGFPKDFKGVVSSTVGYKEPNPGSNQQVKDWLFSLGWSPQSFKYIKNEAYYKAPPRVVPQIRIDGEIGKELCPSVLKLIDKDKSVKWLDGTTVLSHRMSVLKGFLSNVDDKGYVKAEIQGLTNTLRFKHKTVVNLPGVNKLFGKEIRGCLTSPEGYELMGSDMVALEDRTKQHYMYEYDPDYVNEMNVEGFEPHLDIALLAKIMTEEQVEEHKSGKKKYDSLRHKAKTTNYACTYGIQALSLSRAIGGSKSEAQDLIDTYWKRNWAIKSLVEDLTVKTINKQKWLFNPVSKFWYSLRYDKDRFSTLNQGTATYVFDTWVKEIRKVRSQLTGQFHDEVILCIKKGNRQKCEELVQDSIGKVNTMLGLNKQMAVEVQFGENYAEIH